jgi:hypothetical protein
VIQINVNMPAPGHTWFNNRLARTMCDICTAKALKISELADYFREKAGETVVEYYIKKMNEAAASLDELAKHFSTRCRCGDDLYQRSDGPVGIWHGGRCGGDTPAQRSSSELAATHH